MGDGQVRGRPRSKQKLQPERRIQEPDRYCVVIHNDNYTTMDFVVEVLVRIFHKSVLEAARIMLHVHRNGKGIVGDFTYDIAQTKAKQVRDTARNRGFPLKCTVEQV